MEIVSQFVDLFLHLDKHLGELITEYGTLTYAILFAIIFIETGFIIMPFLPGDSLLFAAGALAALPNNPLNVFALVILLFIAAVAGDSLNYSIGNYIGPKVFSRDYRLVKRAHLVKTQSFFAKYGGKTIVIARFMPIVRTFAPFVAGVGTMNYGKFLTYNIIGGALWVGLFLFAGYFFGNLPFVQKNFSIVILAIIFLSILPAMVEVVKDRLKTKKQLV